MKRTLAAVFVVATACNVFWLFADVLARHPQSWVRGSAIDTAIAFELLVLSAISVVSFFPAR